MSVLRLVRSAYTETETQGKINGRWHTIERPWIKGPHPGGMSNKSCVPDGSYRLIPHTRPNGDKVVALVNPKLGVWYRKDDRPDVWGRYLILIHAANFIPDIIGCIGPGLDSMIENNAYRTLSSRAAMREMNVRKYDRIVISTTQGAKE